MGPDEESLYAELRVSGSGAWARLHSDVTSQLLATIVRPDGTTEQLPITAVRGLATDPDPACAGRRTTPSWRRGRPWRSPSPRR